MWKKELTTLVTNNDRVYEKYKDVCTVILSEINITRQSIKADILPKKGFSVRLHIICCNTK